MQPIPFTAASAEEALTQIRAKLGPEAVVLNVRRLPQNGLARLWQKPMIEVLAYRPEMPAGESAPISETLAEFRQQLYEIKQQVGSQSTGVAAKDAHATDGSSSFAPALAQRDGEGEEWVADALRSFSIASSAVEDGELNCGNWRIGAVLRKGGLLPLHAQEVLDQLHSRYGKNPPASIAEEIRLAQAVLAESWRSPAALKEGSLHVLIGPAGSGKTTCLCKWLTQTVLMEGRSARVWRLDGTTANTAESLSVFSEILGAPSERVWEPTANQFEEEAGFIDLPGIDWRKPLAIKELAGQLKQLGWPHVHLTLNGAYDTSILLAQARAFAELPIEDLIITHLDEETRWGKVWNLVLGTNYSVRCFSTGQNIPGDFHTATPEMIFSRQFPCK